MFQIFLIKADIMQNINKSLKYHINYKCTSCFERTWFFFIKRKEQKEKGVKRQRVGKQETATNQKVTQQDWKLVLIRWYI